MQPKKIKKTDVPKGQSSRINPAQIKPPQGLTFSYKYLEVTHRLFNISGRDGLYLSAFLERLRDLSSWTSTDIKQNGSKALRCHPIDWQKTHEAGFGIPEEEQLVDRPYQFSLSSNQHGRVHGFFIEEVFYIVWLDPNHKLYPGKG